MAKNIENETPANNINLVGSGTEITGNIISNGDLRIDGILNGNMTISGKVVVGETGKIKGEITCKNADISGSIEGKVTVSELLSLKSTSNIKGDIIIGKLDIEPGTQFNGNCQMSQATPKTFVASSK